MLQRQKSGTKTKGLRGMGRMSTPVKGMRVLNQAASMYTNTIIAMAASGGVSMPVSKNGTSKDNKAEDTAGPTSWPPSSTPKIMEAMVKPSIQPLAFTSCDEGKSSVKMPYLAGEYDAAPKPTMA